MEDTYMSSIILWNQKHIVSTPNIVKQIFVQTQNQTEEITSERSNDHSSVRPSNIYKIVVVQNGLALRFVKKITKEIYKLAIEQNGLAQQYIKKNFKYIW